MNLDGAAGNTFTAVNAQFLLEHDLILPLQPFRIGTPAASQRAAFKKYDGAYARSVIDGIFLHVEDSCFSFQSPELL